MALACCKCKNKITRGEDFLNCCFCKEKYHISCTSVTEKRFQLMSKEKKENWRCKSCIKNQGTKKQISPNTISNLKTFELTDNITQRNKQILEDSSASTEETYDLASFNRRSINITLNRSCPEDRTEIIFQDLEEYKLKISDLEIKLESADSEIERLLMENYSLKTELSQRDAKINQLTRICRLKTTDPDTFNTKNGEENRNEIRINVKNISTPKPIICQQKQKNITNTNDMNLSLNNSSGISPVLQKQPKNQENNNCTGKQKNQKKKRHKICLLSTNTHNKIRDIAQRNFSESFDICHYLTPGLGLMQIIKTLPHKVEKFTKEDYCIIFIGEEDFNSTVDYYKLVFFIRDTLKKLRHTNILLCLPTYKCARSKDLFNWRVEIFNHILYMDNMSYTYAYLVDSNLKLKYDSTMFHSVTGRINNYGLNVIFQYIVKHVTKIHNRQPDFDAQYDKKDENLCPLVENNFFRRRYSK